MKPTFATVVALTACISLLLWSPADAEDKDEPTVWKLTVSPSAEGKPALRYRLDYALHEQVEGNGALLLGSAMLMLPRDEVQTKFDDALDDEHVDPAAVKTALESCKSCLHYAELAMQRTTFDSGTPLHQEGGAVLLPSLSPVRQLSAPIALRARLEISEGRFDDARRTLRVGYALARRHVEQHTLVEALVGLSIAARMNKETQKWLAAKDSPNLYWSLASLRPLSNGSDAIRGEQSWIYFSMPGLDFSRSDRFTADDWKRALVSFFRISALAQGDRQPEAKVNLQLAALVATQLPAARVYLKAEGMTDEQLNTLQPVEIVGRYVFGEFERYVQDMTKWWSLPYPQAARGLAEVEAEIARRKESGQLNPATALLPALTRARWTFTRLDRDLAAMQLVESLRHHAATHDRKLPEKLDDSLALPAPLDPSTGKPFEYQRTDNGFVLTSPAPEGREPRDALRVEVTFR